MDPATVIGLLVGTALVAVAVLMGGSPSIFFNVPAVLLVVGGTLGATLIRNPLSTVAGTVGVGNGRGRA